MISQNIQIRVLWLTLLICFCGTIAFAQPALPQRTITVKPTQSLRFGSFCCTGSSGTVTVGCDGSRTSTGGIVFVSGSPVQPAIFEIKLCQGRSINITYSPTTKLYGTKGGELILHLGPNQYNSNSFPTNGDCNFITPMRMGGTLDIPANPIVGNYTGTFSITFNQQ